MVYIYEFIEINNVFKKRFDHTLYTSKKIDWFGIKINIKIEGYKLKFFQWWENSNFLITIIIGNPQDILSLVNWIVIRVDENFNLRESKNIYNFLYIENTKFHYLKKKAI